MLERSFGTAHPFQVVALLCKDWYPPRVCAVSVLPHFISVLGNTHARLIMEQRQLNVGTESIHGVQARTMYDSFIFVRKAAAWQEEIAKAVRHASDLLDAGAVVKQRARIEITGRKKEEENGLGLGSDCCPPPPPNATVAPQPALACCDGQVNSPRRCSHARGFHLVQTPI